MLIVCHWFVSQSCHWSIDADEGKQKKYNSIAECISMAFPKAKEMEFFIRNVAIESERETKKESTSINT